MRVAGLAGAKGAPLKRWPFAPQRMGLRTENGNAEKGPGSRRLGTSSGASRHHQGPAGPFSLKNVRWTFFRALEPPEGKAFGDRAKCIAPSSAGEEPRSQRTWNSYKPYWTNMGYDTLPQSASLTAPSGREPFGLPFINKNRSFAPPRMTWIRLSSWAGC